MKLGEVGDFKQGRDVARFGSDAFWKARYDNEVENFEWFADLSDSLASCPPLKALLASRAASKAHVLEIGCGTSRVAEELWDTFGFRHISAIDNQPKAIEYCKQRQGADRSIDFRCQDMTALTDFASKSIDLVFDKGALDALVCRGGEDLGKCAAELWRVMKPKETSILIALSNAPLTEVVDGLKPWFKKEDMWMVENQKVGQLMAKAYLFSRRKKKL